MSFNDKIKRASLPHDRVPVCLNHDVARKFFAADQALKAVSSDTKEAFTDERRGDSTASLEKAREEAFDAFKAEAIWFEVTAIPTQRWNELLLENPPAEGNKFHERAGYDIAKFSTAAFEECAKYVSDEGDVVPLAAEQWAEFWSFVDDGLFDYIAQKVTRINRQDGRADAVFLEIASGTTQA